MEGLAVCFEDLPGPRTRNDWVAIIVIAFCTVLCSVQNALDIRVPLTTSCGALLTPSELSGRSICRAYLS